MTGKETVVPSSVSRSVASAGPWTTTRWADGPRHCSAHIRADSAPDPGRGHAAELSQSSLEGPRLVRSHPPAGTQDPGRSQQAWTRQPRGPRGSVLRAVSTPRRRCGVGTEATTKRVPPLGTVLPRKDARVVRNSERLRAAATAHSIASGDPQPPNLGDPPRGRRSAENPAGEAAVTGPQYCTALANCSHK